MKWVISPKNVVILFNVHDLFERFEIDYCIKLCIISYILKLNKNKMTLWTFTFLCFKILLIFSFKCSACFRSCMQFFHQFQRFFFIRLEWCILVASDCRKNKANLQPEINYIWTFIFILLCVLKVFSFIHFDHFYARTFSQRKSV